MKFKKGCTPWNKGVKGKQVAWNKGKKMKPHTKEHREKISKSMMNNNNNPDFGGGTFNRLSPKQQEQVRRKLSRTLSKYHKRLWRNMSFEEKFARIKSFSDGNRRYWDNLTDEQRREHGRKSWASRRGHV